MSPEGVLLRLFRAPAVHFLLVGGLLFVAALGRDTRGGAADASIPPAIVLTAADVDRLRRGWAEQHGRAPSAEVERALVEEAIDEEILVREARALGFHRTDRVVRERLLRLARFLSDEPGGDDDALFAEALALGLDESDLVVRRYLAQMMRLAASRPAPSDMPSEAELESYLAAHADRFRGPAQLRLAHVYLSRDRRGTRADSDAAGLLARLRAAGTGPVDAVALGDHFLHGNDLPPHSPADLDRMFGPGFGEAIAALEPGAWVGPVRSSYGLHLVWVHERMAARMPTLAAVRNQVLHGLLKERREDRLRARLAALRQRYLIRVPLPEEGGPGPDA